MSPLLILLICIVALIVVILLLIFSVYYKFKRTLGISDFNSFIDEVKQNDRNNYSTKKDIFGMTRIIEPLIVKDFPDFNLKHLYSSIETNLTSILNAKTKLDTSYLNKGLSLIKGRIVKEINDMKDEGIIQKYTSIRFNDHALKTYKKSNGTATITTTSSVSYNYESNLDERKYNDLRCETKYECEFIYIYDEDKFKEKQKSFGVHCPNCGAPVKGLGDLTCTYCGSEVQKVNLRHWEMASFKEIK
jgi:hypothetical protein